jgi:hypothetical protein
VDAKLLARLQKVLALTTSPEEGEAAAAAAMLARMLKEHNLSVADLEAKGQAKPGVTKGGLDLGAAKWRWKVQLAQALAKHFYCVALDAQGETSTRGGVVFVGRPDNVESLSMLYAWLVDQVKEISAKERRAHAEKTGDHVDPLRWQLHFGEGAVERLAERLEERARKAAAEYAGSTALAVSHATEVSDYLEREHGFRADGQPTAKEKAEREARKAEIAKWKADDEAWQALLRSDPEAAYRARPWMRPAKPLTPEEQAKKDAREAKEAKRRARQENAYRRAQERRYEREAARARSPEERRKRAQARLAGDAGHAAGDRVNLEPLLEGGEEAPRARIAETCPSCGTRPVQNNGRGRCDRCAES